ncbi:MAG: hypothetical protein FWD31_05390, partial [Planctomycetaceae bacterium]|nr:hypothetical protein [Planctomycetaceae bacterium]
MKTLLSHRNTLLFALMIVTAAMTCGGCSQSVPQTKKYVFSNPFLRDRPQRAVRMTCFWEPKILSEKQGVTRGFQGEIIFFRDEKMQYSTMIDGELTVYVYDADDHKIDNVGGYEGIKPLCEYRFDRELLAKGFAKNKKTKLMSYGVWLPIDKMPGDERNLVLWAKFEGSGDNGELLGADTRDQITVYLPGNPVEKKKPEQKSAVENFDGIRQAAYNDINDFSNIQQSSYAEAVRAMQNGNMPRNTRSQADTIPMSPGLARQLFNARQQERDSANENATSTVAASKNRSLAIGFGGGDTPLPSGNANRNVANQTPVGYGNGNTIPGNTMPDGMSPQFLVRNRQDFTFIGSQINQQMQNNQSPHGMALQAGFINSGGPNPNNMQQAAWVAQNPPNDQESARRTAIQQE